MANLSKHGTSSQIIRAIKQLNPNKTASEARHRLFIALTGTTAVQVEAMRGFLLGPSPSYDDIVRFDRVTRSYIVPLDDTEYRDLEKADFTLTIPGIDLDRKGLSGKTFYFDPIRTDSLVKYILSSDIGSNLRLSIGANIPVFRCEVARGLMHEISRENAVLAITTALGNVVPSILQPILGAAEAAGDIILLTANQVRMLFMLGAVYNMKIGFVPQWKEISSVIGAAFGWRALARQLVSKIPFGAGLAPKGAIAYAGTIVIGEGIIFYYTTGRHMTRQETAQAFKKAYSDATGVARSLVDRLRPSSSDTGDETGSGEDKPVSG